MENRRAKCADKKMTLQPFLIVEIEETTVKSVHVSVHNTIYKVPSVLKGIDTCFNIFHVLHLKYPFEGEHIWLFIQMCVYKIELTDFDHKIPFIMDIVNKIEILSKNK